MYITKLETKRDFAYVFMAKLLIVYGENDSLAFYGEKNSNPISLNATKYKRLKPKKRPNYTKKAW